MATHSSVLAWRIPWTGEPGGLPSMGSRTESDTTEVTQQQQQHEPCTFCLTEPLLLPSAQILKSSVFLDIFFVNILPKVPMLHEQHKFRHLLTQARSLEFLFPLDDGFDTIKLLERNSPAKIHFSRFLPSSFLRLWSLQGGYKSMYLSRPKPSSCVSIPHPQDLCLQLVDFHSSFHFQLPFFQLRKKQSIYTRKKQDFNSGF